MAGLRMLFILSGLWLCAIVAPSVITLVDVDQTVVVDNVVEVEQQEQCEKSVDGEMVVDYRAFYQAFLLSKSVDHSSDSFYLGLSLDTASEIILPPPRQSY